MKKIIKIAHLYYDLMNLYGEVGNVRGLKRFIERQGVDVQIDSLTIGDKIDFNKYDFYYIGCGNEENEELVIKDLMQYRDDIKNAIESGKFILATGNAMELFGKKIRLKDGSIIPCLDITEYHASEGENRQVSEILYTYDGLPEGKGGNIFGFRNCRCTIVHNTNRIFEFASTYNYKNFYAWNFVGPFIIRNPYFTNMIIEKLFEQKGYDYKVIEDTIEFKAYHKFYQNFIVNRKLD